MHFDTIPSQSKGLTIGEVKQYRSQLEALVAKYRAEATDIPESLEPKTARFEQLLNSASKLSRIVDRDHEYMQLATLAIAHHEPERAIAIRNRLTSYTDRDTITQKIICFYCRFKRYDEAEALVPDLYRMVDRDEAYKRFIRQRTS